MKEPPLNLPLSKGGEILCNPPEVKGEILCNPAEVKGEIFVPPFTRGGLGGVCPISAEKAMSEIHARALVSVVKRRTTPPSPPEYKSGNKTAINKIAKGQFNINVRQESRSFAIISRISQSMAQNATNTAKTIMRVFASP
ncbi:MAG: hypothetical protein COY02_04110 [Parcubacteria group bacterium CG_4_10_14_0_2_um_filter_41_6]|nr:MAG: hypothetical protein COY02_04110 [Parcubacteria group bacterium CG_4_10_14_0_2_um_filter_41_6]